MLIHSHTHMVTIMYLYYICIMVKKTSNNNPEGAEKYVRTGFNMKPLTMRRIKYISLVDGMDLTQLTAKALDMLIAEFETRNGPIPVK